MSHAAILPILLPLAAAAALVLLGGARRGVQRAVSLMAMAGTLVASLALFLDACGGEPIVYRVGGWPAPFGIVLVVDRLSAAMLLLTDVVSLAALVHAATGADARGKHFHVFLHLQICGVHGAFTTGDFFNLFVFFELLLIASYALLLHGGGERRARAGLHYVVLNLVGSTIFLVGLGVLYGTTGALNMAHVAARVPELAGVDVGLARVAVALLLLVFALKSGLVPLQFWLTRAYPAALPEVAASFAIMTKVGIYCIVRVLTLLPGVTSDVDRWLLPAALVAQLVAALGVIGSRSLGRLFAFLLVGSIGVMLTGVSLRGEAGALSATLFYLAHSTVAFAGAFLVAGCVARARGGAGDRIERAPLRGDPAILGATFAFSVVAVVGLPPLPGFAGKAALLAAVRPTGSGVGVFAVVLVSTLIGVVASARAASTIFFGAKVEPGTTGPPVSRLPGPLLLLAATTGLTVFAAPVMTYTTLAADQLADSAAYVHAVLGGGGP